MYNPQTTDNQEEIYDVVNEKDEVIGTATRRQVHTDRNLLHRAAGVFIFNSERQLLMQKRSKTKDTYPGYWVFSVGGHVDSGDSYDATAKRELMEELGIEASLYPLEKMLKEADVEREFWMTYGLVHDGPFPNFNAVEADEVRFFEVDELIEHGKRKTLPLPPNVVSTLDTVKKWFHNGVIDALFEQSNT
jgi:16S rRNA (adenine1518-N6/adenine1519-N6)-dimethyltransferase